MKTLPHFLIAGAPRACTTWVYEMLRLHPDIYLAQPVKPEPKFFLIDSLYERGIDYYRSTWFADVPEGKVAGEKSTNYLESPVAAARIAEHLPEVKLVFILREPARRAYSNYLWSRMNGRETESFAVALEKEEERERTLDPALRFVRPHAYFSRGLYARLLQPYFDRFRREQILCLRFEDLHTKRRTLVETLHRFLGVTPRPEDGDQVGVINAANVCKEEVTPDLSELRRRYAEPNAELARLLGPGFQMWDAS